MIYLEPTGLLYTGYIRDATEIRNNVDSDINTIFDVGANTGGTSLALKSVFGSATVHSFEPFNGNFKKLLENTNGHSDIYTYNVGFSDETRKDVPIGMPSVPQGKKHNSGRITIFPDSEPIDTINLVKMSDWCTEHNIIPDILWMDIEGCEYNVIMDLIESTLIKQIPYIYIEINPTYKSSALIANLLSDYNQIYISGKRSRRSLINYLFKQKTNARNK